MALLSQPQSNSLQTEKVSGGIARRGLLGAGVKKPVVDPLAASYGIANTATQQQAGDYGSIMQGYKDLMSRNTNASAPYQQSAASAESLSNLGGLAQSGGYDAAGIADIRARGMSPIRSIYASANRDVDRQKGLQGGYSPNYGAVKAKMARELSGSVGDAMTNVNATLAQNIASNKLNASGNYASAAGAENSLRNQSAQWNAGNQQQNQNQALQGMTSLYGTTPALASTFGNQALQAGQLQNQVKQTNQTNNLNKIAQGMRMYG